jgi:alpha-ketoglutarate-dependent taurine dioxygenase
MSQAVTFPSRSVRRRAVSIKEAQMVKTRLRFPGKDLLLIVTPAVENISLKDWAQNHRKQITQWLHEYGGILLRGFPLSGPKGFREVVHAVSGSLLEYRERSSPRSTVTDKVYTSTEYPSDQPIFLHNENSYQNAWPMKLFFYCNHPPSVGGQTPIADCRQIYASLSLEIRDKFERMGIMYVRNFNKWSNIPWQTVFQSTSAAEVDAYCAARDIKTYWRDNGSALRTEFVRPLVYRHPLTGATIWFNHATFFHVTTLTEEVRNTILARYSEEELPTNTYYGDGSPIEPEVLDELRSIYTREKMLFEWRKNDILMLDNMLTAHGREPFKGPREILVAMTDPFQAS